jgi:hypothetical protein
MKFRFPLVSLSISAALKSGVGLLDGSLVHSAELIDLGDDETDGRAVLLHEGTSLLPGELRVFQPVAKLNLLEESGVYLGGLSLADGHHLKSLGLRLIAEGSAKTLDENRSPEGREVDLCLLEIGRLADGLV